MKALKIVAAALGITLATLVILPLLGIFEKTKAVPKSISESVLRAKG